MSRLATVFSLAALCAAPLLTASACDSASGTSDAATTCDFNFANPDTAKKDFGESCASGSECAYGVCILPSTSGNIINSQFGFCSRGCNCDNATSSQLTVEQKTHLTCLDPAGFQGAKRMVVPICAGVADCQAIDAGWTACATPNTGAAAKVCQAL